LLLFLDPGSEIRDPGWVKIRIRDKHPGSATLNLSKGLSRILLLFHTEDLSWEIVKPNPPNEIQTVPFVLPTQAIHPNLIYHVSIINRHPRKVWSRKTPGDFSFLSFSLCKH
jgi:hypothetical protein